MRRSPVCGRHDSHRRNHHPTVQSPFHRTRRPHATKLRHPNGRFVERIGPWNQTLVVPQSPSRMHPGIQDQKPRGLRAPHTACSIPHWLPRPFHTDHEDPLRRRVGPARSAPYFPGNGLPEQQHQATPVNRVVTQRQQVRRCLFPNQLSMEPRQEPLRVAQHPGRTGHSGYRHPLASEQGHRLLQHHRPRAMGRHSMPHQNPRKHLGTWFRIRPTAIARHRLHHQPHGIAPNEPFMQPHGKPPDRPLRWRALRGPPACDAACHAARSAQALA